MTDITMETIRLWSYEPHSNKSDLFPDLPHELQFDLGSTIELIEKVELCIHEANIKNAQDDGKTLNFIFYLENQKLEFFESVNSAVEEFVKSNDTELRTRIALRLWSGCISAAKSLSLQTKDGPNNERYRRVAFEEIDIKCGRDSVYRRGVEIAPLFKANRKQSEDVDFSGVVNSTVMRYKELFEEINKAKASLEHQYFDYLTKRLDEISHKESQLSQ